MYIPNYIDYKRMGKMAAKKKTDNLLTKDNRQFITGLAISSMIFGIISILFFWVVFVGAILGILAIVLGISTLKRGASKSISFAGVITGIVALIMNLVMIYFFINGSISYSIVVNPNSIVMAQER